MTFVPIDPPRCAHYAQFASHLERHQFDAIYWSLFVFNLFVLFLAAYAYTKCLEKIDSYPDDKPRRNRIILRCILFTSGCAIVSLVTVIMEIFALMALQFCDGEDLMSLYWSTFTMIQVGSLIAVMGIILAQLHTLRDRKHPPWALALGTPVLVVAGLFSLVHSCASQRAKKLTSKAIPRARKDKDLEEGTLPMSQVNTLQVDAEEDMDGTEGAEIIGLTLQGGPIIHFKKSVPRTLPDATRIIGRCDDDKPIVVCHKDGFRFVFSGERGGDLKKGNGSSFPSSSSKDG